MKFDGLHAALERTADQRPAAIKSRSRFSSSGVQRTLGITQSFLRPQPELGQVRVACLMVTFQFRCFVRDATRRLRADRFVILA